MSTCLPLQVDHNLLACACQFLLSDCYLQLPSRYSVSSPLSFSSSTPSHPNFSVEEPPPFLFWTTYSAIRSIKASCLEKSSLKKKRIHLPPLQRSPPPNFPKRTSSTPNTFYLPVCQEEPRSSLSSFRRPDDTVHIFDSSKLSSNSQEVYPLELGGELLVPDEPGCE